MVLELDLHGQLRDSGCHAQNTTASLFGMRNRTNKVLARAAQKLRYFRTQKPT